MVFKETVPRDFWDSCLIMGSCCLLECLCSHTVVRDGACTYSIYMPGPTWWLYRGRRMLVWFVIDTEFLSISGVSHCQTYVVCIFECASMSPSCVCTSASVFLVGDGHAGAVLFLAGVLGGCL